MIGVRRAGAWAMSLVLTTAALVGLSSSPAHAAECRENYVSGGWNVTVCLTKQISTAPEGASCASADPRCGLAAELVVQPGRRGFVHLW